MWFEILLKVLLKNVARFFENMSQYEWSNSGSGVLSVYVTTLYTV